MAALLPALPAGPRSAAGEERSGEPLSRPGWAKPRLHEAGGTVTFSVRRAARVAAEMVDLAMLLVADSRRLRLLGRAVDADSVLVQAGECMDTVRALARHIESASPP